MSKRISPRERARRAAQADAGWRACHLTPQEAAYVAHSESARLHTRGMRRLAATLNRRYEKAGRRTYSDER